MNRDAESPVSLERTPRIERELTSGSVTPVAHVVNAGEAGLMPESEDGLVHGWFKASRHPDALELLKHSRTAFALAYVIASRSKWRDGFNPHGLQIGEALLGDFKAIGMSEREYRTAKQKLAKWHFATFRTTPKGTVGKLIDSRLFSVVQSLNDGQNNIQATGKRQINDGRTTGKRRVTKNRRAQEHESERTGERESAVLRRTAVRANGSASSSRRPSSVEDVVAFAEDIMAGRETEFSFTPEQAAKRFVRVNNTKGWKLHNWRSSLRGFIEGGKDPMGMTEVPENWEPEIE